MSNDLIGMSSAIQSITPSLTTQSNDTSSDPAQSSNSTSILPDNTQDLSTQQLSTVPNGDPKDNGTTTKNTGHPHLGEQLSPGHKDLAKRLGTDNGQ
jgi:hypothetical protein